MQISWRGWALEYLILNYWEIPQIRINEDAEDYLTSNCNTYDVRDDNGRQFDFERLLGYYTIEN